MENNQIINNIDDHQELERLYRENPKSFENLFYDAYKHYPESNTLSVWSARLSFKVNDKPVGISFLFVVVLALVGGFLIKIPEFINVEGSWFYPRFVPYILLGILMAYFVNLNGFRKIPRLAIGGYLFAGFYLILIPDYNDSPSQVMALLHLPFFLLSLLGLVHMKDWKEHESRINFIKYLGEMLPLSALILLGGVVFTLLTLGLLETLSADNDWVFQYVVVIGALSSPLVATYLFDQIMESRSQISHILANTFAPFFLLLMIGYVIGALLSGSNPYLDRDFLITFNGLILVILAITVYSIIGKHEESNSNWSDWLNAVLLGVTIIVDLIALSAIIFRWVEFGFTVNRLVVAGSNLMVLAHLLLLFKSYFKFLKYSDEKKVLFRSITKYLPAYTMWSVFIAFVLPVLVGFN